MTKISPLLLSIAAVAAFASAPALAESSASSAVSDSASSATSSASNSIEGSSNSSSGEKKVAAGEYRVIEMAAATDKPGRQRVLLRKDDGSEVRLLLPVAAAERGQLTVGRAVLVNDRPYGYEFAAADTKQAFFLVLEDAWQRELQARPVVL